ncbi:putative Zn-dependent peptidase [Arcticibacter tournemirensis]|uniref:Insulinase family protein n=1 Tax=Arcticibacter tournemirensis TaxID=699437 RepID=A0A5M9GU86_9SPHI|nr:pitrilysin family protein [Arcticibacter tournemirensis]KAA8477157.1 insulinase family protein [Arcticibacter tournemirensis]TQM51197.1 putative Zn-dependent peptidase [Arcticibacter tournemirensis]
MIERTTAPAFKQVEKINIIKAAPVTLNNGIQLYVINAGEQELVRVELIFNNVNWNISKPLQAYAVNAMLVEGTSTLTAYQIAERVDYYGAFLQTDYNYDISSVTLYSLSKHLDSVLPIVKDIVTDAVFPEDDLETFKRNQKQKLMVNLEKNDFQSRRIFNNMLFGNSLYGYSTQAEDYDRLGRDELIEYFHQAYQPENCSIIVSGKVDSGVIELLNKYFGHNWDTSLKVSHNVFSFPVQEASLRYLEKPEALQSAIRIGKVSVNRSHPDFPALQVLNTVLGGYFGSRLMSNIREDKGYTYGIGSAVVSLVNSGYFFIASEVGADVCAATLVEIEKEVNLLKTDLIPAEELDLVKNYMLGSFLGSLENAFSHADKFKNIWFSGLEYDYYDRYIKTVKEINSETLLELARFYLDFDSFNKVIVGKK